MFFYDFSAKVSCKSRTNGVGRRFYRIKQQNIPGIVISENRVVLESQGRNRVLFGDESYKKGNRLLLGDLQAADLTIVFSEGKPGYCLAMNCIQREKTVVT